MNTAKKLSISVPLTQKAHTIARKFAAQQVTPQKGKQIYLNTLSVYALHSYLKWLHIKTELHLSHSWHPEKQILSNPVDLVIANFGRLQCCPILPGETSLTVCVPVTEDTLGYVAVQFQESLDQVMLLGFINRSSSFQLSQTISLNSLQPLETLLDQISDAIAQNPAALTAHRHK